MKSYWTFSSKEDIGNVVFFLYQLEENFVCLNRTHDHYTWLIASKIWFVVIWNIHLLVFIFYLLDFLILVNDGRNVSSWSHDRYSYLLTNTQVSKSLVSIAFSYWTFLSSAAMMGQYLFLLLFFLVLRLNDGNVFLFVLPLLVLLGHTSGVAGKGVSEEILHEEAEDGEESKGLEGSQRWGVRVAMPVSMMVVGCLPKP